MTSTRNSVPWAVRLAVLASAAVVTASPGFAQTSGASVDDLEAIAENDDADVPALSGWRRELFGERALALKHGKLALAMRAGKVVAFPAH